MRNPKYYYFLLFIILAGYILSSKLIFDEVNKTVKIVIDEEFHLPQGKAYCERNFSHWDPKITTFPGLYLVSSAFLGSLFDCNTYNLRFINLGASCLNFLLFASILKYIYGYNSDNYLKIVLMALNLTILPPLYFFSHVYYSDTLSVMFLLAFSWLCILNRYKLFMLVLGYLSILMRQTNVVWIGMILFHKILDIMIKSSRVFGNNYLSPKALSKQYSSISGKTDKSKLKRYYSLSDLMIAGKYHLSTRGQNFIKFITPQDSLVMVSQSIILISFNVFVLYNGSIVVGDKTAHQATLHIPQLFYFLIFYGIFGAPHVLSLFISTLKLMYYNKLKVVIFTLIFLVIVHYNTLTHPYLLADNRHYTFYIWNRWFGKFWYAKYVSVPAYVFLLFSLYDNLKDQNCISFLTPYFLCAFAVLCLQKMIEVRYFFLPYIILRLRFRQPSYTVVLFELIWYLAINAAAFNVFFTKEVHWKNYDYVQRIIW